MQLKQFIECLQKRYAIIALCAIYKNVLISITIGISEFTIFLSKDSELKDDNSR